MGALGTELATSHGDMTFLQGKGMYLWRINNVEGGNPVAMAEVAKQAGLSHVLVKVADGRGTYNTYKQENGYEYFNAQDGVDHVPGVVSALRARGIKVWGWQYIYGEDPLLEARVAIRRIQQFSLDGFAVNAEMQFERLGMDVPARIYMSELRRALPDLPIALSSYRYPQVHAYFPWTAFLEFCDLNMPQVYWMGAHNPAEQLVRCLHEFQSLPVWRPIFPTGAAFQEHGWRATPEEVTAFLAAVKQNGLPGCNFWEWYYARQKDSELWNPVRDFSWGAVTDKPDVAIRYVDALNSNDPVQVAALYNPSGVHVTAGRTRQGTEAILRWYNSLLRDTLPGATFAITGLTVNDNIHTLTWTAESGGGQVLDGKDSLGIKDQQIAYHYSFFTVQKP